jgi:hypothetical protein
MGYWVRLFGTKIMKKNENNARCLRRLFLFQTSPPGPLSKSERGNRGQGVKGVRSKLPNNQFRFITLNFEL